MSGSEEARVLVGLMSVFAGIVRGLYSGWKMAFLRVEVGDGYSKLSASVSRDGGVDLLSMGDDRWVEIDDAGVRLFEALGRACGVALISIGPDLEGEAQFEFGDLGRWDISKEDGETGIPKGL